MDLSWRLNAAGTLSKLSGLVKLSGKVVSTEVDCSAVHTSVLCRGVKVLGKSLSTQSHSKFRDGNGFILGSFVYGGT